MYSNRSRRTRFVLSLAASSWGLIAGCEDPMNARRGGDPAVGPPKIDIETFEAGFEVVRSVALEENHRAGVVQPVVAGGIDGELLLAEPVEGQVNVYDADSGRLRTVLGRRGDGPGEFRLPLSARRTLDGSVAVADMMHGRITFFPPAGEGSAELGAAKLADSPVQGIVDIRHLEGDRYLLAGLDLNRNSGRFLHLWDRATGRLERSFLPMGIPVASRPWATRFRAVATALEADAIWAVWALSDTLYQFSMDGFRRRRIPLQLPRPVGGLPVVSGGATDAPGPGAAKDRQTQVVGVFVLDDGDIVVQSMQTRGRAAVWDLLVVGRSGVAKWKGQDLPRLYVVDQGLFYFQDPAAVSPNRWVAARRRSAP